MKLSLLKTMIYCRLKWEEYRRKFEYQAFRDVVWEEIVYLKIL